MTLTRVYLCKSQIFACMTDRGGRYRCQSAIRSVDLKTEATVNAALLYSYDNIYKTPIVFVGCTSLPPQHVIRGRCPVWLQDSQFVSCFSHSLWFDMATVSLMFVYWWSKNGKLGIWATQIGTGPGLAACIYFYKLILYVNYCPVTPEITVICLDKAAQAAQPAEGLFSFYLYIRQVARSVTDLNILTGCYSFVAPLHCWLYLPNFSLSSNLEKT